ncbi:hypothetical protein PspLS_04934 [Pyricularia sp. CBS 133598]|nr:hypothetical protein PspLS_04934 [Pyricularia sp. CBS 133598]
MQFILMTPESFRLGGFALRFRRSRSTNRCLGSEWSCTVPCRSNPLVVPWPGGHYCGVVGSLFSPVAPEEFCIPHGSLLAKENCLGPVTISTLTFSTPQSCLKWKTDGGAAQHVQPNG